jgi:hypothetical protein
MRGFFRGWSDRTAIHTATVEVERNPEQQVRSEPPHHSGFSGDAVFSLLSEPE